MTAEARLRNDCVETKEGSMGDVTMGDLTNGRRAGVDDIAELREHLELRSAAMKRHALFKRLRSIEDLRCFMSWHVFAVWDFMSLVKRLQHEFTSMPLPWTPPSNAFAARLINDIVLGEESDTTPDGRHSSHFDLYLSAMREIGADTAQVERLIGLVRSNVAADIALRIVCAPAPVARFVRATLDCARNGSVAEALGSFLYGREEAIPQMFKTLLAECSVPGQKTPIFLHYLKRHIELDGESHGPAAKRLVEDLSRGSEKCLREIYQAGAAAVEHRIALWDALEVELAQAKGADHVGA